MYGMEVGVSGHLPAMSLCYLEILSAVFLINDYCDGA